MDDETTALLRSEGITDVTVAGKNKYVGTYKGQLAEVTIHENRSRPAIRYRVSVKINGQEVQPIANPEPTLQMAIAVVHWPRH